MACELIHTIISGDADVRNRSLQELCRGADASRLLR
jgi:hypothetical protein